MTIEHNVRAWLDHYGITTVEIVEVRPDRVFAKDPKRDLQELAKRWNKGPGRNHSLTKIGSTVKSLREPAAPSMQIVIHKQLDAATGKYGRLLEIDFDEFNPWEDPIGHTREVLRNRVRKTKTDQSKIAAGLRARGIPVA